MAFRIRGRINLVNRLIGIIMLTTTFTTECACHITTGSGFLVQLNDIFILVYRKWRVLVLKNVCMCKKPVMLYHLKVGHDNGGALVVFFFLFNWAEPFLVVGWLWVLILFILGLEEKESITNLWNVNHLFIINFLLYCSTNTETRIDSYHSMFYWLHKIKIGGLCHWLLRYKATKNIAKHIQFRS